MPRFDDDNFEYDELLEPDYFDDPEEDEDADEDVDDDDFTNTSPGVEVSMEVDEKGNEVWYAEDSRIPGSSSIGHSVEEAMEGVEDRRRKYREMIKKSRNHTEDT